MLRRLAGARFQVLFHSPPGVLFTFPSRYLCAIGHRRVFRLGGWSPLLPTGFHVSGGTQVPGGSPRRFAYGALTLYRRPSQAVPLRRGFVTALCPALQPRRRLRCRRFGLGPRSLAATGGISVDFSSSGYLDVSVPRVASWRPMCSGAGGGGWTPPGLPIRRPAGLRVCAPHRGLSQLVASFFGFLCQGIHRVPLPSSPRPGRARAGRHSTRAAATRAAAVLAIRCDLLFDQKKISFATLCGSQGTARASPRDRTLRAGSRRGERERRVPSRQR